ncbi:MAG TPA: hypothetical protein DCS91_21120 [Microcoleaceae bacterium UBA11344]|nr:hypothetical protein [Microcoleaceae cyanobacterium UBA11344]
MGRLTQINADFLRDSISNCFEISGGFLFVGFLTADVGRLTQINADFLRNVVLRFPTSLRSRESGYLVNNYELKSKI